MLHRPSCCMTAANVSPRSTSVVTTRHLPPRSNKLFNPPLLQLCDIRRRCSPWRTLDCKNEEGLHDFLALLIRGLNQEVPDDDKKSKAWYACPDVRVHQATPQGSGRRTRDRSCPLPLRTDEE